MTYESEHKSGYVPAPGQNDTELITLGDMTAAELFTVDKMKSVISQIKEHVATFVPDITTDKGRKEIAKNSRKVSTSKGVIEKMGKGLTQEWADKKKAVDAVRRDAREALDALRDEVRQPLTDWEDEKKRKEEEERKAEEARLAEIARKQSEEFERQQQELRERQEEMDRKEAEFKAKQEAAEREEQEKKLAAEREAQAKADKERIEAEAVASLCAEAKIDKETGKAVVRAISSNAVNHMKITY